MKKDYLLPNRNLALAIMRSRFLMLGVILIACTALFMPSCYRAPQQIRVAIDPNWYPQNFQDKQFYINGFVDELLLEISKHGNVEFEKIGANWDTLFDGLKQQRYDAVLCSLPPYSFNQAKYDFSKNFLDIGPVLVTSVSSDTHDLRQMSNKVVGVLSDKDQFLMMQKYSNVIMRTYDSVANIFNALMNNEVDGILIDRLTAVGFVKGAYAEKIKIDGSALTDAGLHVVALKDDSTQAVKVFNKNLRYLIKKKKLKKMLRKWQLDV